MGAKGATVVSEFIDCRDSRHTLMDCFRVNGGVWAELPELDAACGAERVFEALNEFLTTRNLLLFLVLDDFDMLYALPDPVGTHFIQSLYLFNAELRAHRVRFVISGSSTVFRELCFHGLPPAVLADQYPSYPYTGSFNERKAAWTSTRP